MTLLLVTIILFFSCSCAFTKVTISPVLLSSRLLKTYLHSFPVHLIARLDLEPLMHGIAEHAGTRRGRQALLRLVNQDTDLMVKNSRKAPSRLRRLAEASYQRNNNSKSQPQVEVIKVATSAKEARREFDFVEQAMLALNVGHAQDQQLTYPPLYGANSSPFDTVTQVHTDDDEWMSMAIEELNLEHVLQAEQVIKTLLAIKEWGLLESTLTWLPDLALLARAIPDLKHVLDQIGKAVEIVRIRSATDIQGKASYIFRLNKANFPRIQKLWDKEEQLAADLDKQMKKILRKFTGSPECVDFEQRKVLLVPKITATQDAGRVRGVEGGRCYIEPHSVVDLNNDMVAVRIELETIESRIEQELVLAISKSKKEIDTGLQLMARLDVIFARAAFAKRTNGIVPIMKEEGCISIKKFLYPVLTLDGSKNVVPVDLHLGDRASEVGGNRCLVISGPNGGGKSVAMKSFGVASAVSKVGVPLPTQSKSQARIDFFHEILVELGDNQSVLEGESTFMAKLNECSTLIQCAEEQKKQGHQSLILLDELGSGTDPVAGGAIGQAILEKLLEDKGCRVVATTHSQRVKALSFNNEQYQCASVLLKKNDGGCRYKLPSYQLHYGTIGDSYAIGAASRGKPPLPEDVIKRIASLIGDEEGESAQILTSLTRSLEKHVEEAQRARRMAEECRDAAVSVAEAYNRNYTSMEKRLESLLDELREDKENQLEIIGNTLATLRLIRKKVKSNIEMLKERGLRLVSPSHKFSEGDLVVIISGPWEGTSGKVLKNLSYNKIMVRPESQWDDPHFDPDSSEATPEPLTFQRHEVAIWDFGGDWS
jgi:hypothetical protein